MTDGTGVSGVKYQKFIEFLKTNIYPETIKK